MDFSELVFEVKRIEKAASAAAKGKKAAPVEVLLPKTIDFSPEEFVDKDYFVLINDYERMIKIAKTSGIKFQPVAGKVEVGGRKAQKELPTYMLEGQEQAMKPSAPQKPGAKPAAKPSPAPQKKEEPKPEAAAPAKPAPAPAVPSAAQQKKGFEFPVLGFLKPAARSAAKEEPIKPSVAKPETPKQVIPAPKAPIIVAQPPPEPPEERPELELEFEREASSKPEPAKQAASEEKMDELRERISDLMEKTLEKERPAPSAVPKEEEHEFEFEDFKEVRKQQIEKKKEEAIASGKSEQEAIEELDISMEEEKPLSQEAKEAIGEVSEIPYIAKHEPILIAIPPILSAAPEGEAERKFSELKASVPETGTSASGTEIKKRMIELTKELFREKSAERRDEIKKELGALRETLARKDATPAERVVSYATSFLNLLEASFKSEIADAKESIIRSYREQLAKTSSAFSSSLKLAKAQEEKQKIYDMFAADLDAVKAQIQELAGKYEAFFLREHTVSLEKVRSIASMKNDKNVVEKVDERLGEIKFTYASEFAALENAINKEISALAKAKKYEALGEKEDTDAEKALAILGRSDDEVIQYVHANDPERYAEFENGKINRLELIAAGRALIAAEEGLKKDVINKYFGS